MRSKGKIFLLDDDELIVSMLARALKSEGYEVRGEREVRDVVSKIKQWSPDIVLLDVNMPDRDGIDILQELKGTLDVQVVMLTADETAETAVKAMKLGAADYLTKPFDMEEVKIVIGNIKEKARLRQEVNYLRQVSNELFQKEIIGTSDAIRALESKIDKMVRAGVSTILVTGESGTGKGLLARHIHYLLHKNASEEYAPFIAVNCAALPEHLLESELFGYEKGSFTDAKSEKKGLFELAQGGTILLDEIGIMKFDLQGKLLRVIEERAVRRIGGKDEIPVDVTIMSTTNKDLADAVEKGEVRLDLFYRLNAFSLSLPPLRERKEDILPLASHFLSHFTNKYNKRSVRGFSNEAEKLLTSYRWPGNVRELKNVIERIVVLEDTELVQAEHLPREIFTPLASAGLSSSTRFLLPESGISLDEFEKDLFKQALSRAANNKTLAAKLLGISYDSLRYSIKKYGLE